jgi:xylulokinase
MTLGPQQVCVCNSAIVKTIGIGTASNAPMPTIALNLSGKIPELKPSDASIGNISASLVDQYGFLPDCAIDAGCGDNMYGAVGTGNVEPGIVTISLGTSGTAYTYLEEPFVDSTGEIAAFCDSTGHYLPLLCVSNLANGYNEILKIYDISHSEFNEIIQQTPPGNQGRILLPWYVGERTPDVPQATPLYFGFALDDFTKPILCRAVLEGHILNLYDGFRRMPVKPKEIRLTGGLSQSEAWSQTIADIFEAEVVPIEGEGAAAGAALHAAWVWMKENGKSVSLSEVVTPFVRLDESQRKKPIPENVDTYRIQKEMFHALSKRVRYQSESNPFDLRNQMG